MENQDVRWMRLALQEAEKGRGWVEPNPLVGAVVVREGQPVAMGHHDRFGGPHAEIHALRAAGEAARSATLYITLEPCSHFGKTPPCTHAIREAGIARVVAALRDPFPQVNGRGLEELAAAGIQVETGVEALAARSLNAPYLKRLVCAMPFVTAKWAMTLDGKTAVAGGDSRWITREPARRMVHEIRGRMDAIIVGIGTALADDPLLTARPPGPRAPVRVVLDSFARLSLSSRLAQTAREVPVLVAVTRLAPERRRNDLKDKGCDVLAFPTADRVPVVPLLEELSQRGMTNVLLEGGGLVAGSFLDAGQIDAVDAFIAPLLEGGDHTRTPLRGQGRSLMDQSLALWDVQVSQAGPDLRVKGQLWQAWRSQAGFPDDQPERP
jgi:diaminohydroxyphosphoribosylaminopyrimidine deaminase / 5-amino-6-(5-phosphoribosylamino)uracil reductase